MRNHMDQENPIRLSTPRSRDAVFLKLGLIPDIQMIYVAALACTRHRNVELIELQRQGCLSFLMFDEVDMVTGDYINKTQNAAAQIAAERNPSGIILMTGCQSALLSTDYGLLTQEIEAEIGVPVRVHDGCRLCGFDEEAPDAGVSPLQQLPYDFIRPAEKSEVPSVNILGSAAPDENSELFSVLKNAGVKKINCIAHCKTREEYQEMGRAHLNIILSAQEMLAGPYLQEKLGIPWVCLGGIYDSGELERSYQTLEEVLGISVDISAQKDRLDEKLEAVRHKAGGCTIAVEGDPELAKWLLRTGFSVTSLQLSPHQGLSKEQRAWFEENAPALEIKGTERGGDRSGGEGRGRGEGRERGEGRGHGEGRGRGEGRGHSEGRGRGEGRNRGENQERGAAPEIGFQASIHILETLERAIGGRTHE